MKKTVSILLSGIMSLAALSLPTANVYAANAQGSAPSRVDTVNVNDYSTDNWMRFTFNYEFASGPDTKDTFGVPTPTDAPARNPGLENVRRNKDASFLPPSYGVFSGEIPTGASSLFHYNDRLDNASNITYSNGSYNSYRENDTLPSGHMSDTSLLPSASTKQNPIDEIIVSQTAHNDALLTQSVLYEEGSLGTIQIPKLNLNVRVFEGETLDNLKRGVGHFEFTSIWNGNVGIAGHNRGSSAYLNGIWNLQNGDEIIFTTKYGQRIYSVFSIEKISDTDYSKLSWTNENLITLITCAANEPTKRWAIQAVQKI